MKRLLINLILIALIYVVARYFIVPQIVCWQDGGAWKWGGQVCDMGTFEFPSMNSLPSMDNVKNEVKERINFSELKKLQLLLPDMHGETATLNMTDDSFSHLMTTLSENGQVMQGFAEAFIDRAVSDTRSDVSLIPFVVNYGGTGSFVYVGLFVPENGVPIHKDSLLIGDRVEVTKLSFDRVGSSTAAVIEYLDREANEAMAVTPHIPRRIEIPVYGDAFGTVGTPTDTEGSSVTHRDLIRVTSPMEGSTIASPVTVTGEARGSWFFEASFPISVVDWDGRIIGEGFASANGDWMTTDFVPFTASVSYSVPAGTPYMRGAVILRKDNPSGISENDDAVEIPVVFNE